MTTTAREQFVETRTGNRAPLTSGQRRQDHRIWLGTSAIVALLFLALENQYWIPGGDSELYIAIARNLIKGNGYMFNGRAAHIAPPGWPWVLAFLIKFVSPSFLLLKLVTLACMTAGLSVFYRVIRRFASPLASAGIILLTAVISHVYSLTFWLHSDALFTLLTALSLLLALQISEGKRQAWRIAALVALCILATFVRWAGLPNLIIVIAALLQGRYRPARDRVWIGAAIVLVMTIVTFRSIGWGLQYFARPNMPPEETAAVDTAAQVADSGASESSSDMVSVVTATGKGSTGYATRFLGFGTWPSYLLWQPFRMAAGFKLIWWIATACGWIVLGIMIVACVEELKQQRWLLPATFVYMLGLDLNWPQANARYLVPLTPLILLTIVRGVGILQSRATTRRRAIAWRTIGIAGFASVILCNATLYAVEVSVMRSADFKNRYEAGVDTSLLAIANYLNEKNVGNWQACVNLQYHNLNKRRMNPTGLRKLSMLTGKAMLQVPQKFMRPQYKLPRDHEFRDWVSRCKVRYYIEQPVISPWRVWHFRLPWLQRWMTGRPVEQIDARWVLFRCDGRSKPVEVPVPELDRYPTRVPGF